MELSNGSCTLCKRDTKVFSASTESFTKQIQYAFFAKNKDDYLLDFSENLALCIICCSKLQISFDFKKSYDEMCNKNNKLHHNKCFFCESRMNMLVDISETMRDFSESIKVFLNSVIVYHRYDGLSTCIRCIYNLNIWLEIRNCIYSLMNLPESVPASKTHIYSTRTIKRSVRKSKRTLRLSNLENKDEKQKWKAYLKKRLELLQTADKIIKSENLSFEDETFLDKLNDKLFKQKVYVSISINSQIGSSILQNSSAYETIVINDSDNEEIRGISLRNDSKTIGTLQNKTPFKIKFSPSFSKSLTLRTKYTYTCAVCDKGFFVRCDYLLHLLKHEKMESVIINVPRYNLPTQINVCEFEKLCRRKSKMSLPAQSINKLLTKWIGEHLTNTFDESDEESEVAVDEIVEETDICNNVTEMVVQDNEHEEKNVVDEVLKNITEPSNSVADISVTEIDTGNLLKELIDLNCQTEVNDAQMVEKVKEIPTETSTCNAISIETSTCNEGNKSDVEASICTEDDVVIETSTCTEDDVVIKTSTGNEVNMETSTCNEGNEVDIEKNACNEVDIETSACSEGNEVDIEKNACNEVDIETSACNEGNEVDMETSACNEGNEVDIEKSACNEVAIETSTCNEDEVVTETNTHNEIDIVTSTCNEDNEVEIDGNGNSELQNLETITGVNTDVCAETGSYENEEKTECNKDVSPAHEQDNVLENEQDVTEDAIEPPDQENDLNPTLIKTKDSENASEKAATKRKILSLKSPKNSEDTTHEELPSDELNASPNNTKIVSCEELLSILEGTSESDFSINETTKSSLNVSSVDGSNKESFPAENWSSIENLSGDDREENIDNSARKRKRMEDDIDETPKRKRVRFASEKVIMTPDKSILLERVSEGDDIVPVED